MSPTEITHRFVSALRAKIEQRGLGIANAVPTPDLSAGFRHFVLGGDGMADDRYVTAADETLAGKLPVFALDYTAGATPRWNLDPKSGREAPLDFGKTIDYRNEALVGDIKYLWEPNRHLHLVTLAQAWRLSGERRYLEGIGRQIESWLNQCPYLMGPNWASSLELAIRLINWSIVWQLIGGFASPLFENEDGQRLRDRWIEAIYRHMHFVRSHPSRFSSANNHLIGELAGLFVGAVTWPHWSACRDWADEARDKLEREIMLQNGADGVNREQAISYQQFVLDFLLISALAGRANGRDFSDKYWKRIEAMLGYLVSVMDFGGNVPMIGDADDGYVVRLSQEPGFCPYRSLLATGAVLFNRGDFRAKAGQLDDKTRWLLGSASDQTYSSIPVNATALPLRREFREGGYYVLGSEFETPRELRMIADAGPLGYLSIAAHGHADALAFTLSVGGHEILIDPGTYAYHTQKKWRDYFRGTAAHNTITVDGENQSEIGGNFLWLRKANARCEVWETGLEQDRFVGSHDGYRRLDDPVVHRREIQLEKAGRRIVVTDTLDCAGQHRAKCRWHFSETCEVWLEGKVLHARNSGIEVSLRLADPTLKFELHKGEEDPPCGWVSRSFDVKIPTVTAVVPFAVQGRTTLITEIVCGEGSADVRKAPGEEQ